MITEATDDFIASMMNMTDDERVEIFEALRLYFCEHCGRGYDPCPRVGKLYQLACQCTNDE